MCNAKRASVKAETDNDFCNISAAQAINAPLINKTDKDERMTSTNTVKTMTHTRYLCLIKHRKLYIRIRSQLHCSIINSTWEVNGYRVDGSK